MDNMSNIIQVGEQVRVISYCPFRGLKGVVRKVDTLPSADEPFCFYFVALQGAFIKSPIWFEYDEVERLSPHTKE